MPCSSSAPDANGDRRVVSIRADLPAWRGLVMPVRGATGVLELPAGTVARVGLEPGDVDPVRGTDGRLSHGSRHRSRACR